MEIRRARIEREVLIAMRKMTEAQVSALLDNAETMLATALSNTTTEPSERPNLIIFPLRRKRT